MARGDAVYARGNVDWPLDPLCQALPDNDCRWLHELLWRIAVKERSPVVPPKYDATWLAWAVRIPEERVLACVKTLAGIRLLGIDTHGHLVVHGVMKQHPRIKWKVEEPETIPLVVVKADNWQWGHNFIPIQPHTGTHGDKPSPYDHGSLNSDALNRHTSCSESPRGTREHSNPPASVRKQKPWEPDKTAAKAAQGLRAFKCDGPEPEWWVSEERLKQFEETYKTIIVEDAIRAAWQWIEVNPTKRKTASGMPKFLNNWLKNAVNRGEHKRTAPKRDPRLGQSPAAPDLFLDLCKKLHAQYPNKSKPEISRMADNILERRRANTAAKRDPFEPTGVGDILKTATKGNP